MNLVYPNRQPVPGTLRDSDPDQPTGPIDYLMIRRMSVQKGSEPPKGFFYNKAGGKFDGLKPNKNVVYLACPPQVTAKYTAKYQEVAFGTVGVAAGEALAAGPAGSGQVADIIGRMAGDATPEFVMNSIADATRGAGQLLGQNGNFDKNDLLAVSQGKIFNPYEEQIFKGTGFRTFNFQFKLVARNEKEASDIGMIIGYLKEGMLPHMGGPDTAVGGGGGSSNAPQKGRYLYVPDKFKLEFKRMDPTKNKLENIPHIKFVPCVLENIDVSYTPDGQYTSFKYADAVPNKLKVPAVTLSLNFKETAYITKELAGQGY